MRLVADWPALFTIHLLVASSIAAQGPTSGSIRGRVTDSAGTALDGAEVSIANRVTGEIVRSRVHEGRYAVFGLQPGGPYQLVARQIGYRSDTLPDFSLSIGQQLQGDFVLTSPAAVLPVIVIASQQGSALRTVQTGAQSTLTDSLLHRLPTSNRNIYDLVQIDSRVNTLFGISADGVSRSFNAVSVDGAPDRSLFGGNPAGTAAQDAVQEYQILIAPFDVRWGGFAGAMINAVTRSGTNELHGSAFVDFRNQAFAPVFRELGSASYQQWQFGASAGGPLIKDRVHFFVAAELHRVDVIDPGPYVGQPANSAFQLPTDTATVGRFARTLEQWGLTPGTSRSVTLRNPLTNLFARVDASLFGSSRLSLSYHRQRDSNANLDRFDALSLGVFPLGSQEYEQRAPSDELSSQLSTNFTGGSYNEVRLSFTYDPIRWVPSVQEPAVAVTVSGNDPGALATLQSGTLSWQQGDTYLDQRIFRLADDYVKPVGRSHQLMIGIAVERSLLSDAQLENGYGNWRFSSLDSLAAGQPRSYVVAADLGGARASLGVMTIGVYGGDQWAVSDRLILTGGVRMDLPSIGGQAPYSPTVDSLFDVRTDLHFNSRVQWSPRLGFSWALDAAHVNTLRGGAGTFVGMPPLSWWINARKGFGFGIAALRCGGASGVGEAPAFDPDHLHPPVHCLNNVGALTPEAGGVDLLSPDLRFPRTLRVGLGFDRRLPWQLVATLDALYTRSLDDYFFVNRNLVGPVGSDRHGRVLYGTFDDDGVATPQLRSQFDQVMQLRPESKNHSASITAQLVKHWSDRAELKAAYTWSRVRDVQTTASPNSIDDWNDLALAGRHDVLATGISDYDQPHRVVVAATYRLPWRRWTTDVSAFYVGASGLAFTYTAAGDPDGITGDLNADGTNLNDPVYVPRHATDTAEVVFAGSPAEVQAQQRALDRFIDRTPCLRQQRGQILARNSCRAPWTHLVNAAVRQSLPTVGGHPLSLELQLFNLLNLLDRNWGHVSIPTSALLTQVGETAGSTGTQQPIFRYNASQPVTTPIVPDSYYQLQLALRYAF